MRAIGLMLAACSAPAAPVIGQRASSQAPRSLEEQMPLVERGLLISATGATRGKHELTVVNNVATLVETDQEAPAVLTMEQADREVGWVTTDTKTQRGPFRHDGDHVALDMEGSHDALSLRCFERTIVVATAGAVRVKTPGIHPDCSDPGAWSPPATTKIEAWICGQGEGLDDGQRLGIDGQLGSIDLTLFRFAPAPGVELVEIDDACFESRGLRLAK